MPPEDDLSWTTSRCNRLLRHISSPLAALRKEREKQQKTTAELRIASTAFATKSTPRKTTNFSQLASARKPRGFEKACDPDWKPGAKPTGVKKTYGGRAARTSAATQRLHAEIEKVGRPGEIAFTPLIARTGDQFQSSPQIFSSPIRPPPKKKGPLIAKGDQLQIKKHMPHDTGKQVEGLLKAYANLLSATAIGEKKRRKGTRSLMSVCLRQVHAFIELEEHFTELDREEDDNDEERDITNEIYTELEDRFERCAGQGWRPLKSIVRAHGTDLLCSAFTDQILTVETLQFVVSHCFDASAWDEAEKLLLAYLPTMKPLSMPPNPGANLFDQSRSTYLWMAKGFVDRTGRSRFLYDVLEHTLSHDLLPLEWLATDCMRPLWHRLVRTLTDGVPQTLESAFRLLETAISVGIGLPVDGIVKNDEDEDLPRQIRPSTRQPLRDALDTTFISLLTVLSSIALVNHNRADYSDDSIVQRVTSILNSIVIGLLKRSNVQSDLDLLEPTPEDMVTYAHRALWTISASFLLRLGGCSLNVGMVSLEIPTLVEGIDWVALQYSSKNIGISSALATLPAFISSTARCTGKAWQDDGFDQLQRLSDALLSLSGFRLPHKLWNMKRLALESSLEFAQSTNNAEHIAYARQIERSMKEKGRVVLANTPHKNGTPSAGGGFRWEEGIGEWVTCTPFVKQGVKHLPRKPMRALELLPTPVASEDEPDGPSEARDYLAGRSKDLSAREHDVDFYDDTPAQSSPVKAPTRKRRSTSPVVIIPTKRTCITPPESPANLEAGSQSEPRKRGRPRKQSINLSVLSTTSQPEPRRSRRILEESFDNSVISTASQSETRRSRRSRKEIKSLISNLRKSRSRASLDSNLRKIGRKSYTEFMELDNSESEEEEDDVEVTQTGEDVDDRDELHKTPAGVERRRSGRRVSGRRVSKTKTPWCVAVPGDDSEDELSFQ